MRLFTVIVFVLAQAGAANAETYYTDIGDRRVNLEVPEGYCALTGEDENENRLMEILDAATADGATFQIAFAECGELAEWRQGQRETVDRVGYIASASVTRFAGFSGNQDDLNRGMQEKFSQMPESELGRMMNGSPERAQAILDRLEIDVQIESTASLGYLGYDSSGTYFGVIQKVSTDQNFEKTIAGVYSMITIQDRFLLLYFWGDYSGDVAQIDELLETVKWFSSLQHAVN